MQIAEVYGRAPLIVAILLGVATQMSVTPSRSHCQLSRPSVAVVRPPVVATVPVAEPTCDVLEFGPYLQIGTRRYFDDPHAITGRSFEVDEVEFIRQTTEITRKLRTGFGVRYRVHDLAPNASVTWRVKYPHAIRGVSDWSHDPELFGDHSHAFLYDFDHAYEMVPGRWEFSVLVDGKTTCDVAFTVK